MILQIWILCSVLNVVDFYYVLHDEKERKVIKDFAASSEFTEEFLIKAAYVILFLLGPIFDISRILKWFKKFL